MSKPKREDFRCQLPYESEAVEGPPVSLVEVELAKIREGIERLIASASAEADAVPIPSAAELASLACLNRGIDGKPDFAAAWDVWLVAAGQVQETRAWAGKVFGADATDEEKEDRTPMGLAVKRLAGAEDAADPELDWGSDELARIVGGKYPGMNDKVGRGEGIFDTFEKRIRGDYPDKADVILARFRGGPGKRPGVLRSFFHRYWTKESGVAVRKLERERKREESGKARSVRKSRGKR